MTSLHRRTIDCCTHAPVAR